jgi:hypothetical protein
LDEGLEKRWQRHAAAHRSLAAGLKAMGFELLPPEAARLPMLNAVQLPDGFDDAALRKRLLVEHGIEVGAGLGELKGRILRVGLMGLNANRGAAIRFLAAFEGARGAGREGAAGRGRGGGARGLTRATNAAGAARRAASAAPRAGRSRPGCGRPPSPGRAPRRRASASARSR